jgi:hypothetical protein
MPSNSTPNCGALKGAAAICFCHRVTSVSGPWRPNHKRLQKSTMGINQCPPYPLKRKYSAVIYISAISVDNKSPAMRGRTLIAAAPFPLRFATELFPALVRRWSSRFLKLIGAKPCYAVLGFARTLRCVCRHKDQQN